VGQRFPIDPPFGLVAMAWRDDAAIEAWLRGVTPRLTRADIAGHRQVLADIRDRGYGAWRFDDAHPSLHDRLATMLASMTATAQVTRQLRTLMTMVTLQSVPVHSKPTSLQLNSLCCRYLRATASRSTKSKFTWASPRR
jgi:hypothetical protein